MLHIDTRTDQNVVIARPEGQLSDADFNQLGKALDEATREQGHAPGLVIRLDQLPHWDGLDALRAHMTLVMKQQAQLPRIAVVTDNPALGLLPNVAGLFVKARMRHFAPADQDGAVAWAGGDITRPEGYQILHGYPDNVIALRATGEITSRDYTELLIPLMRAKAREHDKLRVLMELSPEFENYSLGAIWDDAGLGLTYWRDFERVALVADSGWITRAAKLFAPLVPGILRIFPHAQADAAKEWISEA